MNTQKHIPTYGAVVSSLEYDKMLKRRNWLKHNKNRLILGGVLLLIIVGLILSMMIF